MGFTSFTGRLLFASVFLFTAWQEFLMCSIRPWYWEASLYRGFNEFGVDDGPIAAVFRPKVGLVAAHVSSLLGVQLAKIEIKHILATAIALKGIGGILFIAGSPLGAYVLLLHVAISTPILYDFYNYNLGEPEFFQHLTEFAQGMAFFGALLFFIGMRKSSPRRQSKKRVPKSKRS